MRHRNSNAVPAIAVTTATSAITVKAVALTLPKESVFCAGIGVVEFDGVGASDDAPPSTLTMPECGTAVGGVNVKSAGGRGAVVVLDKAESL